MKKFICITICFAALACFNFSSSQILDKIKNKVKVKADQKVDQGIDKGLDKAEESVKKPGQNGNETTDASDDKTKTDADGTKSQGLKSYSKYDFVPGDKIGYAEDFSQDVIGEFPMKWNTNGTGEIVTVEGLPGKWLKITESTKYQTPFKKDLPENYTVEFDLLTEFKDDQAVPHIQVMLVADKNSSSVYPASVTITLAPNGGISVPESRDAIYYESLDKTGHSFLQGKKQMYSTFNRANHKNNPVHVAMWIQKQRIRVWINQDKMYDLPKGIAEDVKLSQLGFETTSYGGPQENYKYFISNLKIAEASPDTRSKLITEGKWSTTGILFDVNSDKIKPSSYGTLKEIATTLTENADVKVKIIGHTDSDGDDAKNLDLSKRRAAAVKTALSTEFNIDASRIETDGMGETKPVGDNKTPEGKAQNRRVEFIKIS